MCVAQKASTSHCDVGQIERRGAGAANRLAKLHDLDEVEQVGRIAATRAGKLTARSDLESLSRTRIQCDRRCTRRRGRQRRRIALVAEWVVDDAGQHFAAAGKGDRNRVIWVSMHVIRRAVERIDNPNQFPRAISCRLICLLFADKCMFRIPGGDDFLNGLLRSDIGIGD